MKNDNLAEELLDIKKSIEYQKSKLEQMKGQRIAALNQLKEMGFTLEQAVKEMDVLQTKIESLDDKLEIGLKKFSKEYPKLEIH